MDQFNETVSIANTDQLRQAHADLSAADAHLVEACIDALADRSSAVVYLDDLTVHTIDRADDSPHSHVNDKEIVSGDATAWFAVDHGHGEDIEKVDVQYGVYAGSSRDAEFVYDPVEVEVSPK